MNGFEGGGTDDGVSTDADGGGDAHAGLHDLVRCFIGERSGLRHDTHLAFLEHEAGHDAHLAFVCGDHAGAVGADKGAAFAADVLAGGHHVLHGNALGDAHDHLDACFSGFHDGIGGEGRWNEDDADVSSGGLNRITHRLEHRTIEVFLAAFARGDTTDHVGAVLDHLGGVEGTLATGETLDDDLAVLVDEYAHGVR